MFRTVAMHNMPPGFVAAKQREPVVRYLPKGSLLTRVRETLAPVQIADLLTEPAYTNIDTSENATRVSYRQSRRRA